MGHTPCARYIYLRFDSEVSWGCVNQYHVADLQRVIKNVWVMYTGSLTGTWSLSFLVSVMRYIGNTTEETESIFMWDLNGS